jgi:hypothetical protein
MLNLLHAHKMSGTSRWKADAHGNMGIRLPQKRQSLTLCLWTVMSVDFLLWNQGEGCIRGFKVLGRKASPTSGSHHVNVETRECDLNRLVGDFSATFCYGPEPCAKGSMFQCLQFLLEDICCLREAANKQSRLFLYSYVYRSLCRPTLLSLSQAQSVETSLSTLAGTYRSGSL